MALCRIRPAACVFAVGGEGVVRALLACPSCSTTMTAVWPAILRFECKGCGIKAAVTLPPPPMG